MTAAGFPSPPVPELERLLVALTGVLSARVVVDAAGRPQEIHVLADPALHPKQVVRNVESALNAAFGLDIDRRIISVAQADGRVAAQGAQRNGRTESPLGATSPKVAATASAPELEDDEDDRRVVYVGFEATSRASRDVVCRVILRRGEREYEGTGEGPETPHGRTEAGARALFAALAAARGTNTLVLEGVTILDAHGRDIVLVAAHAIEGRRSTALVGTAPLGRSPEEAAVFAALQATNRWAFRPES